MFGLSIVLAFAFVWVGHSLPIDTACASGGRLKWNIIPGFALADFNDNYIGRMSELECLKSCANFAKFLCRSADYQTGRRECWIQSESRFTFPEKYRNFTDYKMIDWQCEAINSLYFQGVQGRQIPSPDVAAVGPMTSGSELECALACLANQRCDLIVFKLISSSKGNCRLYNSIMVPDTKWQPATDELVFKDESRINF